MGAGGGSQLDMVRQLQELQQKLLEAQNKLAEEAIVGSAGGGAVEVTITGDQRCKEVRIDPEVLQDGDVELLQDLLMSAFNVALEKSREMAEERLGPLTTGLGGLGLGF